MINWKKFLLVGGVLCLLNGLPVQAADDLPAVTPVPTEAPAEPVVTPTPKPELKNGWATLQDGIRKRYYKNGKYLKGMQTIKGKTYYFLPNNGTMATGWKTINNKKYYFGTNGVRREGLCRINAKYYLFDKNGVQKTGSTVKMNGRTYYLNSDGICEAKKIGSSSTLYKPNGQQMTKGQVMEYDTLKTARKIAAQITNDRMSKSEKLYACFKWVMAKNYRIHRVFSYQEGWAALFANDHFKTGTGDCVSDACAFAFLAKAIGYTNVYVGMDSATDFKNTHTWTEINGLVYDPLFAQAKSFSRNYGVGYRTYGLWAMKKYRIA